MFTDIVTSTDLVGLIGDEAWSEVLRLARPRAARVALAEHSGEEVDHTGDGFFVAFERRRRRASTARSTSSGGSPATAASTVSRRGCASGCTPPRRRGEGRNYTGQGVHVAARVGAAAARKRSSFRRARLGDAGPIRFRLSEPRSVTLKGVKDPVEVRSIAWQPARRDPDRYRKTRPGSQAVPAPDHDHRMTDGGRPSEARDKRASTSELTQIGAVSGPIWLRRSAARAATPMRLATFLLVALLLAAAVLAGRLPRRLTGAA